MHEVVAPDGVRIAYRTQGAGPTVVLLHGLSADGDMNWEWTGIGPALRDAGFRTVALDQRGHGRSDKPHDPAAYDDDAFAADITAVLDDVGVERCAVAGYSMGAYMALRAAVVESRITALVLGGIGDLAPAPDDREAVARALEAVEVDEQAVGEARSLREYADATGADRHALAAIQRGRRDTPFALASIDLPALVIAGDADDLAAGADRLAGGLRGATLVRVPGDHASVLIQPRFREAVVAFLEAQLRD